MGREVRRAEKGFDWPMDKTWWGYTLHSIQCLSCEDGVNPESTNGYCPTCDGVGTVRPIVEPPALPQEQIPDYAASRYPGWQMWETISEGSPISPVCETPEALAQWLADNRASWFGRSTATYDQWLAMIQQGSAPSMIYSPSTGLIPGVEAAAP